MKLFKLFTIVIITILFTLTVKAQTYEHFSAFSGIQAAKTKVQEQGFTDYKLIFIGAYNLILNDQKLGYNTADSGNTQNWYYIFACDNDSKLISIGVTKQNGVFITDLIDNCQSDQIPKIGNIQQVFNDFKELPADLLNSDSLYIEYSNIKRKIQTKLSSDDISTFITRFELASKHNLQISPNNSGNEEYFWVIEIGFRDYSPIPLGPSVGASRYVISAKTGALLDLMETTEVVENSNSENLIVYPNPASDFITIQSSESSEILIFNILGERMFNTTPTLPVSREGARIDISSLSPGMYFIKIGNRVEKFVKM